MSGRLERDAAVAARGGALAGAVEAAAWGLRDGLARAEAAALARRGTAAGGEESGGGYWRAEGDATRQLDALGTLALEPGLGWMAARVGGLREAVLSRMAATDEAIRQAGVASPDAAFDEAVPWRIEALAGEAEAWRRGVAAGVMEAAASDRRGLGAAAVIEAVLLSALALAGRRPRPGVVAEAVEVPAVPAVAIADVAAGRNGADRAAAGLRVLLVEDNEMVRFSMEAMLSDLGYAVAAAGDADEAMGLAGDEPDVLVTDLGLPGMDGVTLARRLRAARPSLRVVVASGRPGEEPGMVWLQKPFDLERLRGAVEASAACPG